MQLFYHPHIKETSKEVLFDKEESRHIIKVLRKKEGDTLHLTNGNGYIFNAVLVSANPKQCIANIEFSEKQPPLNYKLHLAVAPTKLNDRYEWFLEKATEIGITEITPIICDHSERKVVKIDRYEKKVLSAMKQSLKAYLPIIHPAITFKQFINSQQNIDSKKLIAHCEETEKKSLKNSIQVNDAVTILIGPEGDFSSSEIALARQHHFIPISLGESRLRTETAAIVACHSVAFVNEV